MHGRGFQAVHLERQLVTKKTQSLDKLIAFDARNRPHDWVEFWEPVTLCRENRCRFVLSDDDVRKSSPSPAMAAGFSYFAR